MPMRFQSLDLNMGDNYVDKHRFGQQTKNLEDIEIEWINYSNFINEKEKRVNELLNNLKDKIEKVLLNDKHDEILRLINLSCKAL